MKEKSSKKRPFFLSPHFLFFIALLLIILFIFYRFSNWGVKIDLDDYFSKNEVEMQDDTLDSIFPLLDQDGKKVAMKEHPTIMFFGNDPFALDRDSEDGLVNLIQKQTGGKVYNMAISGSHLSSQGSANYTEASPYDSFSLYWMLVYLAYKHIWVDYHDLPALWNGNYPKEFDEVLSIMDTVDMSTVDVIAIMYDGQEYLDGVLPYNDDNFTDINTFNGNLEASLELLQAEYPHIRIIVMSPTYAYALEEDGSFVSSDLKAYRDNYVLSSFVQREGFSATSHGVSFIDNFYGTVTEDNAHQYLEDHIHLNQNGRQLVADRFVKALYYYSN